MPVVVMWVVLGVILGAVFVASLMGVAWLVVPEMIEGIFANARGPHIGGSKPSGRPWVLLVSAALAPWSVVYVVVALIITGGTDFDYPVIPYLATAVSAVLSTRPIYRLGLTWAPKWTAFVVGCLLGWVAVPVLSPGFILVLSAATLVVSLRVARVHTWSDGEHAEPAD